MPEPQRKFSKEYKLAVVEQVWEGKSVPEVAAACGLAVGTLYHWVHKLTPKPWRSEAEMKGESSNSDQNGQNIPGEQKSRKITGRGSPIRAKRKFSKEFKLKVVQEIDKHGVIAVAEKRGLRRHLLYRWYYRAYPERKKEIKVEIGEFEAVKAKLEQLQSRTKGPEDQDPLAMEDRSQYSEQRSTISHESQHRGNATGPKGESAPEAEVSSMEPVNAMETEMMDTRAESIREIVANPLSWLQKHTQTKDSHWREAKASSPFRPFPDKPYFRPMVEAFQKEPVLFLEKSRDMMISWLFVGLFTHTAMTTPGIEVLFQSQKEEKAFELVGYAKTLYKRQSLELRQAFPLKPGKQGSGALEFANGSRIIGIPGGGEQIRSYHPWGLFQDEAAFMPEAGEAYDHAVPVCEKIVVVSSAGPGWFANQCQNVNDAYSSLAHGLIMRRMADGRPVYRVHYSADPERGAAWVVRERKKYSSQGAWEREQEIVHEAGGGERLFAEALNRWADKIIIDHPQFQPSPHWKWIAGFDHGKANPTAALVGCVDHDGVIYILGEYYQPGLSPKQHRPNLAALRGFMSAELVMADPSIFYTNQAQGDGSFKAIADLYYEEGITNFGPAPQNNELLGMERILSHWTNLETREPTLKIVCPRHLRDIQRPIYGLHNDGCPNLLWELRRARREELSAGQLVNRNPTERIVDKDNHLRDALKYMVLSLPEPAQQPGFVYMQQALTGGLDMTSFMAHYGHTLSSVFGNETKPIYLGGRGLFRDRTRGRR